MKNARMTFVMITLLTAGLTSHAAISDSNYRPGVSPGSSNSTPNSVPNSVTNVTPSNSEMGRMEGRDATSRYSTGNSGSLRNPATATSTTPGYDTDYDNTYNTNNRANMNNNMNNNSTTNTTMPW